MLFLALFGQLPGCRDKGGGANRYRATATPAAAACGHRLLEMSELSAWQVHGLRLPSLPRLNAYANGI